MSVFFFSTSKQHTRFFVFTTSVVTVPSGRCYEYYYVPQLSILRPSLENVPPGHYVPTTAQAILMGNAAGELPKLNLKGFIVGNAWTNATADNSGAVEVSGVDDECCR